MRVVVNRQPALGARTGIGHYTAELLSALEQQAGPEEIHAYPTGWVWRLHARLAGGSTPRSTTPATSRGWRPGFGWVRRLVDVPAVRGALRAVVQPIKFRHFQAVCRREKYDLYHEPNILAMPCDVPTIATLHDLSAVAHPEWHPADRVKQFQRHLDRGLAQCTHLITGSDYTRQEIIDHLGVAPERVTRVYHGIRDGLKPLLADAVAAALQRLGLPPTYLLHVGTLEPRKNLALLLHAYCSLPGEVRERCPLLLVGKWGWNTRALADLLHSEGRFRNVLHVGYISEEDLPALYNGARALVYPSLYEGFGLPPLEMMACGGAVLASTAGSVAEIVGPCAHLVDPADEDGWRAAMHRIITDEEWRRRLQHGVRQWVRPFTWERCAAQTLATYRRVLGVGTDVQPLAA
jgi:alpha-1,3-rhamnosyl/mannosyltransferase